MTGIYAVSETSILLPVGDVWLIHVRVRDLDGLLVDAVPVVTVTLPSGSTETPTVETVATGDYRTTYEIPSAGRFFARAATDDYGVVDFTAYAAIVTGSAFPTVIDVETYIGDNDSHTAEEMQSALDAEAAAQRIRCDVPALYPADLREALLRRVARNLAMRQIPLAVPQGDAEMGPTFIPGKDPEVRRLEAPYLRWVIG